MSNSTGDSWQATRKRVLDRDGHACRFCSMSEEEHQDEHGHGLHAHHIVPKSKGGEDTPENLITVCTTCHRTVESIHNTVVSELKKQEKYDIIDSPSVLQELFERSQTIPSSIESRMGDYLDRNPSVENNLSFSVENGEPPFTSRLSMSDGFGYGPSKIDGERQFFYQFGYHKALNDLFSSLESIIDVDEMYEEANNE